VAGLQFCEHHSRSRRAGKTQDAVIGTLQSGGGAGQQVRDGFALAIKDSAARWCPDVEVVAVDDELKPDAR